MYQANYWKDNFPNMVGNKDFVDGIIVTLLTFGWLRSGVLYIGQPPNEFPVYLTINELKKQLLPEETANGKDV